jgi:predicted deacylase
LNGFKPVEADHVYRKDQIEDEIRSTAAILSLEEVMDIFTPRVSHEESGGEKVLRRSGQGFETTVRTAGDVEFTVKSSLTERTASKVSETLSNTMQEFGTLNGSQFSLEFKVTEDMEIELDSRTLTVSNFKESARNLFRSPITNSVRNTPDLS